VQQLALQADVVQASQSCGLPPSLRAINEEEQELFYQHQVAQ